MEPLITLSCRLVSVLALGFLGRLSTGVAVLPLLLTLGFITLCRRKHFRELQS